MLFYLDNARSKREFAPAPADVSAPGAAGSGARLRKRGGINENYARELMELHTLGVDGGYTQADVREVARCFTGWAIDGLTGEFKFQSFLHDNGTKTVLGHRIAANGGIRDGELVLDILAGHPSTARFIARKLCVRFVADEPPATLVDKIAATFMATAGDLKAVMKVLVTSAEFNAPAAYRSKIKSPLEYAVSAVRALGVTLDIADAGRPAGRRQQIVAGTASMAREAPLGLRRSLVQEIANLGQPLYAYQAPTGYHEDSREWVSTGALVARLNFALALTGNQLFDVKPTWPASMDGGRTAGSRDALIDNLATHLLNGAISPSTRSTLQKELATDPVTDTARLTALLLGSPEFQRR
jgi:uncharacterized protein (DUF1800 family)